MITIPELNQVLYDLFTCKANELAKKTEFVRRHRQISGANFAQALVFGGLTQPEASRKQVHQSAVEAGIKISLPGLDRRFTVKAVHFLKALLEEAMTSVLEGEGRGLFPQFNGVYITDCTQVRWTQVGVKIAVRLEINRGSLQAQLTDIHCNDQKTEVIDRPLPPKSLHLGDLGFFKLDRFRKWSQEDVYWLTRFKIGTTLMTQTGEKIDLRSLLKGKDEVRLPVQVGARNPIAAFLIASRLSPEVLVKRLARLKEQVRLDQHPLSQAQVDLQEWTIYLTNIPNLTFEQAFTLARVRWQIELLFKLWKSHGKIIISRSADPIRQQCEGYAKLIGVLVAHWTLLTAGWNHDRLSPVDALHIIRDYALSLRQALFRPFCKNLFEEILYALQNALTHAPRHSRRKKVPLAFQQWYDFEESFSLSV